MYGPLVHLAVIVGLIVVGVLIAGVWNMSSNNHSPNLSQKLMRWRIGLQFVAIVIAMIAVMVARH
ncbi:MAG: twin transmembrane helix small protein [Hyphomicrobiaceae bacterium]